MSVYILHVHVHTYIAHVTHKHNFYEKASLVYVPHLHLVHVHVHVCSSASQSCVYPGEHEDINVTTAVIRPIGMDTQLAASSLL